MSELKKISLQILALVVDLVQLSYKIIKQVSLPNRKRKGNLLASLFIFFVDVIERLDFFKFGMFSMAAIFRKKYVKHALFVIGIVLFLLSLFEATCSPKLLNEIASTRTEQLSVNTERKILVAKQEQTSPVTIEIEKYSIFPGQKIDYCTFSTDALALKKFLLNCSLRI